MAEDGAESFIGRARYWNYAFEQYRRNGMHPIWSEQQKRDLLARYENRPVPGNVGPRIRFDVNPFNRITFREAPLQDIAGSLIDAEFDADARAAQLRLEEFRSWFEKPRISSTIYSFQKVLGWGGQGIAAHYRVPVQPRSDPNYDRSTDGRQHRVDRDIVVKFSRRGWQDDGIQIEAEMTRVSRLIDALPHSTE